MPIQTHTCITVTCDVCDIPFEDFEDSQIHFATRDDARKLARHYRWSALSGGEFLCPERDDEHQQFLDRLLPPEPVTQIPGQLGLDGTEES
ncbi:hypothetical protein [Streptomyces mirabilis]|uniref:hypothetical protein n=1 Tax=Streptomyces mirabilis TaxID=68239 RepID=UPI0036CADFAE